MCYCHVNSDEKAIFCGSVGAVGKLECAWNTGLDVGHNQPLEALNDDGGECNGARVLGTSPSFSLGNGCLLRG